MPMFRRPLSDRNGITTDQPKNKGADVHVLRSKPVGPDFGILINMNIPFPTNYLRSTSRSIGDDQNDSQKLIRN